MKIPFFSFLLLFLTDSLLAQVKFNLGFTEATQTYTVSVLSEVNYPKPKNILGSAQIVIRAKYSENFTPLITSMLEGTVWTDNAYIDFPMDAPEYTYVCVSLANGPVKEIPLEAGEEVILFSFKNAGANCPGVLELAPNSDEQVLAVRSAGYNVTQHFGLLGARGNAYSGNEQSVVECTELSGAKDLERRIVDNIHISPVPADRQVVVQWVNLTDIRQNAEILVYDNKGREVHRERIAGAKGAASILLDVGRWAAGLYTLRFQFDKGGQTQGWHFMVMR